jgi:hypothetical protein
MNSRVVGIIKFEASRTDGRGTGPGLNYSSGQDGLSLEEWLAALVGEGSGEQGMSPRWETRKTAALVPRRVRADVAKLAEELDREYLELAAG